MKRRIDGPTVAGAILAAAWLSACGSGQEGLEVTKVFATEPVLGERTALYLTIVNHGPFDDVLEGASSPVAGRAEIHRTVEEEAGGGMEKIGGIPIPPDTTVSLRPGGYHVMLLGLRRTLERGDTIDVILSFRKGGELAVRAPVVAHSELESALEGP